MELAAREEMRRLENHIMSYQAFRGSQQRWTGLRAGADDGNNLSGFSASTTLAARLYIEITHSNPV